MKNISIIFLLGAILALVHGEPDLEGTAFQAPNVVRKVKVTDLLALQQKGVRKETKPLALQPTSGQQLLYLPRYYPAYYPYPFVHSVPSRGWFQPIASPLGTNGGWFQQYPMATPLQPNQPKPDQQKETKRFHHCDYHGNCQFFSNQYPLITPTPLQQNEPEVDQQKETKEIHRCDYHGNCDYVIV